MSSSILLNLSSSVAIRLCIASVSLLICCWSNWSGFSSGIADGTITTADIPSPVTPLAIILRNILPPYYLLYYLLSSYYITFLHSMHCVELSARSGAANDEGASHTLSLYFNHAAPRAPTADVQTPRSVPSSADSIRCRRQASFITSVIAVPRIASGICAPNRALPFPDNRIVTILVVQDAAHFCKRDECRIGGTGSSPVLIGRPTLSKDLLDAFIHSTLEFSGQCVSECALGEPIPAQRQVNSVPGSNPPAASVP
jgi:hypothetical protein